MSGSVGLMVKPYIVASFTRGVVEGFVSSHSDTIRVISDIEELSTKHGTVYVLRYFPAVSGQDV